MSEMKIRDYFLSETNSSLSNLPIPKVYNQLIVKFEQI